MFFNMFVSNFLIFCNLSYYSNKMLGLKAKRKNYFIILFIFGVILLSFKNHPSSMLVGTLIMTIYYVVFVYALFEKSILSKLLVIFSFILTIALSEVFSANIMNAFFSLNQTQVSSLVYLAAIFLSNIIAFIIFSFLNKVMEEYINQQHSKYFFLNLILPLTTLFFLYSLTSFFTILRNHLNIFVILCGLIVANIVSLNLSMREFKRIQLETEIKKVRKEYDILHTQYNNTFKFLHDTIRSLSNLNNLITKKEYTEVQKEILVLNNGLTKSFNIISTNFSLLSIILNYKINSIIENNISLKTVIEFNDFDFMELQDQQLLFSNMLDVSLNSCKNCGEKKPMIIIKSKKIADKIILQFLFSSNQSDEYDISNVEKVVKKYGGSIIKQRLNEYRNMCGINIFLTSK